MLDGVTVIGMCVCVDQMDLFCEACVVARHTECSGCACDDHAHRVLPVAVDVEAFVAANRDHLGDMTVYGFHTAMTG